MFGLRKIGKSSLLRRVQSILAEDSDNVFLTCFLQCNASKIKSGRWTAVLEEMVSAWRDALRAAVANSKIEVSSKGWKLAALMKSGASTEPAMAARAFEEDFTRLLRTAIALAKERRGGEVRFVAFFDEADEIYPNAPGASYWTEDYFDLWNTLQTIKRSLDDPKRLVYFLGGVNPAGVERGAFGDRPNPLFEVSALYLGPLDNGRAEPLALLNGLGALSGLVFESEAGEAAYSITGGHPWLLRKLGSLVHRRFPERSSTTRVSAEVLRETFDRAKRTFYAHIDWILTHLERVAPDEARLLRDIATGGATAYEHDWADNKFRETFASHLENYGLCVFQGDVPVITIGLVTDALRRPTANEFPEQKRRLKEAVDSLEAAMRVRFLSDLATGRSQAEAAGEIAQLIPREAKNRAKSRDELQEIGSSAGLRAMLEALNWNDYAIIVEKRYDDITWSGVAVPLAERLDTIQQAFNFCHVVRHNNDHELRSAIALRGFDNVYSELRNIREMFSA